MSAVTFEVINSAGLSVQDPIDIDLDVIPRKGELVSFFDRLTTVKNVRHEFSKSPRRSGVAIHKVTVILEAY
ncbi:hypothetical protein D3C87_482430 [compost metagenome]